MIHGAMPDNRKDCVGHFRARQSGDLSRLIGRPQTREDIGDQVIDRRRCVIVEIHQAMQDDRRGARRAMAISGDRHHQSIDADRLAAGRSVENVARKTVDPTVVLRHQEKLVAQYQYLPAVGKNRITLAEEQTIVLALNDDQIRDNVAGISKRLTETNVDARVRAPFPLDLDKALAARGAKERILGIVGRVWRCDTE